MLHVRSCPSFVPSPRRNAGERVHTFTWIKRIRLCLLSGAAAAACIGGRRRPPSDHRPNRRATVAVKREVNYFLNETAGVGDWRRMRGNVMSEWGSAVSGYIHAHVCVCVGMNMYVMWFDAVFPSGILVALVGSWTTQTKRRIRLRETLPTPAFFAVTIVDGRVYTHAHICMCATQTSRRSREVGREPAPQ